MSLEYKVLGQDSLAELLGKDNFVAVAQNTTTAAHSTNGITWTASTMPVSAPWRSVTYGADKFVAVAGSFSAASAATAYSTDGITWTASTMPVSASWSSVTYGADKFVAVSAYGYSWASSTDGIAWTERTFPGFPVEEASVTFGGNTFVAVGTNSNFSLSKILISTDAVTWTEQTGVSAGPLSAVTYGNGLFVAVSGFFGSTKAIASTDGITWTVSTPPVNATWTSVTYGADKFVAVSGYGAPSTTAAYSTDGINWTASTMPVSAPWRSVTYGADKFVAVAQSTDSTAYSTDGITWTASTMPASAPWQSVTYGLIDELDPKTTYTVPSSKQSVISSIFVSNNSASSQTYSVAVVPSGETLSPLHYIRKDVSIDANDFNTIETKITLSAGDQIITESSSTDVVINIFGVEK